jgi:acetyl-CoA decarbonylase/synthase complex subunit delta
MQIPDIKEKWTSQVSELTLGATKEEGGTRAHTITIGGAKTLPFIGFEGDPGNKTVIAMDVLDIPPTYWPEVVQEPYRDVFNEPGAWAKKCVEEFGADMICIRLEGIHPDQGDNDADHAVKAVRSVAESVGVPLIVWGCGDDEKDNQVFPKVSEALRGEKALLGPVTQDNYKTVTAVCLADGHALISLAPIDINIAKQVNILVSDMDFPLSRIVMFQATGALGYGIEYAYSIQERERLAALTGDKMMAMPVICDVGYETWRAKEAKSADEEAPQWGPAVSRGPMWEAATAITLLQSGADIIRMRHPKAVSVVKKLVGELFA